ncbi:hypothetical protein V2J09_000305 [Rumex salicifolius]
MASFAVHQNYYVAVSEPSTNFEGPWGQLQPLEVRSPLISSPYLHVVPADVNQLYICLGIVQFLLQKFYQFENLLPALMEGAIGLSTFKAQAFSPEITQITRHQCLREGRPCPFIWPRSVPCTTTFLFPWSSSQTFVEIQFSFDSSSPIHGGKQLNFLIALQIHSDFWFDAGQEIPKKLIVSYPGGMRCTSNDFINEIIY